MLMRHALAGSFALVIGFGRAAAAQPAPAVSLPLVYVLSTGGTISGQGASSTALADYKSGALLGEQLIAGVPEIAKIARVKVEQIANVSSTDITIAHWITLANRINAIYAADPTVAGVVITHGTNTLEETAYFLNLTVKHDRPVVLVGSMRPASAISADGPLNLLNGVRTAVAPEARGKGVLVVLNDAINAARDVTKTNTYRRHRGPLLKRLQVEMPRLGFTAQTPIESTSPIVTFAHNDLDGITKKLAAAKVDVRVAKYWMRISPSLYNDMGDVDRLLEALS